MTLCRFLMVLAACCVGCVKAQAAPPGPAAAPAAGERAAGPVTPEQGTLSPAGKFTPKRQAEAGGPGPGREQAEATLRDALKVATDGPGRYRIGQVSFDRTLRTVTIPAKVNMDSGVVEYALVSESGKVHEAVFATKARPEEVHLACLLLGMPPLQDAAALKAGAELPAAQRVQVKVTWESNGPRVEHALARLVLAATDPAKPTEAKPLPDGPWLYNGSVVDAAGFAAGREGSIIALITDSSALVNNPREGCRDDEHHLANQTLLPRKGSPVLVILTLPPATQ